MRKMLRDGVSMFRNDLTAKYLRELLHYDPETGIFVWKIKPANCVQAGAVAGSMITDGYLGISIKRVKYAAHRLAWLYVHGEWPKDQLDHVNGVRDDNRIVNLRESTQAENMQNAKAKRAGKFSLGTTYNKGTKKWQATIRANSCTKYLGLFDTQEEAHQAYAAAKLTVHTFSPVAYSQK